MKRFWIGRILKGIVFFVLAATVFGYVVMSLWNWLIPSLFTGMHVINFWEAIGILVLAKILFGFGRGGGWGHHHHGPPWKRGGFYWSQKWQEKIAKMTPEERERFKADFKNRCRGWSYNPEESFNQATPPPSTGDTKM